MHAHIYLVRKATTAIDMKILIILLAVTIVSANPATNDCTADFQSQLNQTLEQRRVADSKDSMIVVR